MKLIREIDIATFQILGYRSLDLQYKTDINSLTAERASKIAIIIHNKLEFDINHDSRSS